MNLLRPLPVLAMPAACIVRSLFATAAVGAFSAPTSFAELSCLFARLSLSPLSTSDRAPFEATTTHVQGRTPALFLVCPMENEGRMFGRFFIQTPKQS